MLTMNLTSYEINWPDETEKVCCEGCGKDLPSEEYLLTDPVTDEEACFYCTGKWVWCMGCQEVHLAMDLNDDFLCIDCIESKR